MSATPPPGPPAPAPEKTRPERGSQRGGRPELDQEDAKSYARYTGWLLLAILVAYIGLQLPLPWRLLSAVAGLAGVVGAAALLVRCVRRRLPALVYISAGLTLICCGFFALTSTFQAIFWDATVTFETCQDAALTERATAACYREYEEGLLSFLSGSD
ncbi:hypothetical protein [Nesterenkonia flava]|uniref:Transmembrane protein n=1 Tax=Nesterenkonia flava TaxID=469799 RepID=A0ABU1FWQ5_9MICC|nr:hypothetical protein [Nesterenkonia flava]MDR5712757.1 hypothetical protein [Nesterenkonia flava]